MSNVEVDQSGRMEMSGETAVAASNGFTVDFVEKCWSRAFRRLYVVVVPAKASTPSGRLRKFNKAFDTAFGLLNRRTIAYSWYFIRNYSPYARSGP